MPDANQTHHFFHALFAEKPENSNILIWTLQSKESLWATTIEEAESHVKKVVGKRDVYFGVGLAPEGKRGSRERCLANEIVGISGLWADIDIADPHHKKNNLPPDNAAAMDLVRSMGMEPSIIVHSGHGIQAMWLFREPWIFDTADERDEAEGLSQRWTATLRYRANQNKWDVDSVWDLSRILRVPGTMNRKGEPVPVMMITCDPSRRYDPSEFEEFILADAPLYRKRVVNSETGDLELNPEAQPPFDKFDLLQNVEPKVLLTWNRKRKDFQDQSSSSYDMALATYAAYAQWTDQEITNLLIASRRKHEEDLKLRQDYYQRTIHKAREAVKKSQAEETLDELSVATEMGIEIPPEEKKETIKQSLSEIFGIPIKRILKEIGTPPMYIVETERTSIRIGEVKNLIGVNAFRNCMADAGKVIPKFKGARWDRIAQMMLDISEETNIGEEATDKGMAHSWIIHYLEDHAASDDPNIAAVTKTPFRKNSHIYIFGAHFQKWLQLEYNEKVSARAMGSILRSYGCEPEQQAVEIRGENTTRNVWKIPK